MASAEVCEAGQANNEGGQVLRRQPSGPAYQYFMLILSAYSIAAVLAQTLIRIDPQVSSILDKADFVVCAVFFLDFLVSFWTANDRWRYLRTWGWLDFLSSIPAMDAARWGRIARIARILRVLRGLRAAKILADVVVRQRAENGMVSAALAAFLLIVSCSIAILIFESANGGNITTGEDAVWWALTTVTTVGYGDHYPVTSEGRVVAGVLMLSGVGLFGAISGFLAAWFVSPNPQSVSEMQSLRREMAVLQISINRMLEKGSVDATSAEDAGKP